MKRFIAFVMAAVLLLCAVSCGEAEETPTDTTEKTVETRSEPMETDPVDPGTEGTINTTGEIETIEPDTDTGTEGLATDTDIVTTETEPVDDEPESMNASDIAALFSEEKIPLEYTVGEDRYDIDCTAFLFSDTAKSEYSAFVNNLQKNGFTLYTTNGRNGINKLCAQATLYNDNYTVNATWYKQTAETYITVEAVRHLSPLQIKPETQVLGTNAVYHNPKHPNDAKGNYAFGECDIFQLSNNHFVIVDGAQEYSAQMLVEYLEDIVGDGNTPIVDAWFFTHAHPDHIYCAWGIGRDEDLVDRIKVNGFYYTWPNDAGVRRESDYEGLVEQIGNLNNVIGNFCGEDGNVTPTYKLHAGMVFYVNEIKVEILLTQDQLMPNEYQGGFNDSSTSFKFTVYSEGGEETTFLIMGDAHRGVCTKLMEKYDYNTLHTNFFTSLHHGNNDIQEFFEFIKPDYIIYTAPQKNQKNKEGYTWLERNSKGVFVAGDVIELPYTGHDAQQKTIDDWIEKLKEMFGW